MQFHYYHDTTDKPNADDYPKLFGATLIEVWETSKPEKYPYTLNTEGNSFLTVDVELVGDDINSNERQFCFAYNTARIDDVYPPTTTLPSAETLEAMLTSLING